MSIPSQVTHNLKCPPELPSLLIFSSQFMRNSKYPQVIIPLDFLVSIHGQLAPSNVCRKISPSILIFWSQFMVHLHRVVLPDHLFSHCLIPLGLSRPRYSPLLGLSRPSCSTIILQYSSPHTDSSKYEHELLQWNSLANQLGSHVGYPPRSSSAILEHSHCDIGS